MANKKQKKTKTSFWDHKQGYRNVGRAARAVSKEGSCLVAYGFREMIGQPHRKPKCTLKKHWFE